MFRTTGWHVCWLVLVLGSLTNAGEAAKPSAEQIKTWRAEGPAAVDRLMREREKLIAAGDAWKRVDAINDTIDTVAAAKYSHESGLYWYTDEADARRVAKEQGKPLLVLRLLGNLNEELSCANSRYFRILLYPDDRVRKLLHDQFVLTWKSVRPVPKITVDLGDGRMVERTITGNSVHYVVLPSGEVVDVFPGLYGPVPFADRLEKAHAAAELAMREVIPETELGEYRKQRIAELTKAWQTDVAKYREILRKSSEVSVEESAVGQVPAPPPSFWDVAADFHPEYSELSNASRALIEQETQALMKLETRALTKREVKDGESRKRETSPFDDDGPGFDVGLTPTGPVADLDFRFNKGGFESPLGMLLACVEPALRADTVYSEYRGRFAALTCLDRTAPFARFDDDGPGFAPGKKREPVDILNDFVYTEIFLYDPHDPWIGLARLDGLAALPKDRGLKSKPVSPSP